MFGMQEWEKFVQKITAMPISQSNPRAFSRLMFSAAAEVQFDGQGRVLIPDYLRSYAHLDKQVVVAGVYNRMEIWDEELWNDYKAKTESASDDIAEQLGELGI
jgi:MraZ protein